MVMAQQDKFYTLLVEAIGLPELAEDPRFKTMKERYKNRDVLLEILTERFKMKTTAEWIRLLEGKLPVAPVNSIPEALKDPQVDALGLIIEYEHPTLGKIKQTGPPFRMEGYAPEFRMGSSLGADTHEVLTSLAGFSEEELDRLRKTQTI